jgi:hypothetical protein
MFTLQFVFKNLFAICLCEKINKYIVMNINRIKKIPFCSHFIGRRPNATSFFGLPENLVTMYRPKTKHYEILRFQNITRYKLKQDSTIIISKKT